MKIFCVGRNYAEHAMELNNPVPEEPVIFLKPDTALLRKKEPFFYPKFTKHVDFEAEIVLRIGKQGKNIEPQFASRYIEKITIGIDFTARDIQKKLKEKGLPWEKAKGFDRSAAIGKWIDYSQAEASNTTFSLEQNGVLRQTGNTADLLFSFDQLIAHISTYFTLKTGDLIFTGTPEGVGAIKLNDTLTGYVGKQELLRVNIK